MPETLSPEQDFSFTAFPSDTFDDDESSVSMSNTDLVEAYDEDYGFNDLEESDEQDSPLVLDSGVTGVLIKDIKVLSSVADEVSERSDTEQRRLDNLEQFNRLMTAQKKMVGALLQIPYALKTLQKWYAGEAEGSVLFSHIIVRGATYWDLNRKHGEVIPPQEVRLLCGDISADCATLLDYQSVYGRGKQEQDFVDKLETKIADQMMGLYFKKKDWMRLNHALDKKESLLKQAQAYKALKEARAEIKEIEEYFADTNKGFVRVIASKMDPKKDKIWDKDDRFQSGNDGLLMALEKWMPERGGFLTYAKSWIVQRILRAEDDEAPTLRIPTQALNKYKHYIALRIGYEKKHGVYPAPEEMDTLMKAEGHAITSATLEIFGRMPKTVYVQRSDEDTSPREFACDKIPSPHAVFETKEKKEILAKVMKCLTAKEARVIALHNGLPDPLNPDAPAKEHTLDEIGQMYGGITRERVRQIEAKAILKMKARRKNVFPNYHL